MLKKRGDDKEYNSGAAYVFVKNSLTNNWEFTDYLKASNPNASDWFGVTLAVGEGFIAVGAYAEDSNATGINQDQNNNSATESGAVYIFH